MISALYFNKCTGLSSWRINLEEEKKNMSSKIWNKSEKHVIYVCNKEFAYFKPTTKVFPLLFLSHNPALNQYVT